MRIGNNIDMSQSDNKHVVTSTNYSKVENTHAIRLDITDIGKDTGFIIDQGRSMQDVISEASALDVQTRQDYMTVVSNTMSEEDYARMCKDGFKPSEMSGEESVTIMDHIKAVMAQSGDVVAGFNDDLDVATLKSITGSEANANILAKAMKEADIPQTEANAKKINEAANEIQGIESIKDSGIQYMLLNGIEPTIDNIYLANYSVGGTDTSHARGYYSLGMQGYLAQKADVSDINNIKNDIEKAVAEFEIDDIDFDTQIKEATWLVEKGIDVTKANIEKLDDILGINLPINYEEAARRAAFTLAQGNEPKKADLSREDIDIYSKAADIIEKNANIDDNQIKNVVISGKRINLSNLWSAESTLVEMPADNSQLVSSRASLEEIRLRMTLDVNVALLKRGIDIDTMPLSNLVESLKAGQKVVDESLFGKNSEAVEIKGSLFNTTRQAVNDIPFMPAAVIGRLKLEAEYSLSTVHEVGTELKAKYEAAGERYETLMTAPRRDMGDSISKAFRNVDDILTDLGLEVNEENAKAVRILGYNSMEISASEISRIREATDKVMNAVNSLTPARTLELIRQGINPMEMSVDNLAEVLQKMDIEDSDEKYSRFLYKLDKSNEISESERKAYIGIYRLVNKLERTDAAAIGALVNGNSELTFKNLLSGMRSRGVKFNETIDDNYGFLQDTVKKGVSISDQIEQAFIKTVGNEKSEALDNEYIKESYKEYMNTLSNSQPEVSGLISESELVSADNIAAYNALNNSDKNVFGFIKKFDKDQEIDHEKAKDYKDKSDALLEAFDNRESAKAAYASFIQAGNSLLEEYKYTVDNNIDLNQIRLCNKQLSLAFNRSTKEQYTVPVEMNGELTTINLTLKHGNSSSVEASFISEKYGQITAHFTVESENVSGMIVSESKEGVGYLENVVQGMTKQIGSQLDVRVIVGKEIQTFAENGNDSEADADINNVDTASLYRLAKNFLKECSMQA